MSKIDTHHHFVFDAYAKAVHEAGDSALAAWHLPEWSPSASLKLMDELDIRAAILSLTTPGTVVAKGVDAQRKLAREANEYAAKVRDSNPSRFGFFASLPSLLDIEGTLAEIAYAFDVLKADGVTVFSRYGPLDKPDTPDVPERFYLGHAKLRPVWEELNKRSAVVFVHPTVPADKVLANPALLPPHADFTHETTRSALDMLLSSIPQTYTATRIILSHAGGSLPYTINRLATLKSNPQLFDNAKLFYYDMALSTDSGVLDLLLKFVGPDHILYGSDFPYASADEVQQFNQRYDEYQVESSLKAKLTNENGLKLFPRLM